jgi:ribosomal protein L37AE/L43A
MNRFKEYWKYLVDLVTSEDYMYYICEFCNDTGKVEIEGEIKKCPECGVEDFTGATNQER